jgi:hypothetical protein
VAGLVPATSRVQNTGYMVLFQRPTIQKEYYKMASSIFVIPAMEKRGKRGELTGKGIGKGRFIRFGLRKASSGIAIA